jgi:argininosuccinate lyase
MPGYTHLQVAQPMSFAHYLMAYVEMLARDRDRIEGALKRMDECPLGSAALAGTSFPVDRHYSAKLLGFAASTKNSIDSVSDRDFALEFLFIASMISMHLSRLAEEMIIFSSQSFGFIKISERYSSGSSIMPQKRNPDSAELIRAKSGKIFANLTNLFMVMKALPLSYNKDMQEDKAPLFDSAETILLITKLMAGVIDELEVNHGAMLDALSRGHATATDLADWLVKNLQLPFRQAHHLTGQVVKLAEQKSCQLHELTLEEIRTIIPTAQQELLKVLEIHNSVASRKSYGGTAPSMVKEAIAEARINYGI